MQFIYIGFWDSMLNWMLNAILKPVITFLGSLLSKVFSWLFNSILGPLLRSLAVPVFEILLDLLKTVFSGILYSIMAELLKLVDYMEKAFRIIIGLDAVEVKLAGATAWAKAFGASTERLWAMGTMFPCRSRRHSFPLTRSTRHTGC